MRCRPRNLQARRRRWPLRLGLFLIYILVQYVSSTKAPSTSAETTTTVLSSSAQWTSEPSVSSIGSTEEEQAIEEASTVAVEEPRKSGHAEGSKSETPPRGHGRAKAEKTGMRGLAKETAKIKETTKKETETPPPRHGRNSTTNTVSVADLNRDIIGQPSGERGFCETRGCRSCW